jgi:DNA-binding CsgD family transcriptional regulator/tetratricopeptide (TPR) repeat protein/energy-coupling factor transporter ATP-binding protein EcfA2
MDVVASRGENPHVTLLERESQLGSLLQYADEAGSRKGRLVLISGEAGVGKSSLVEELQQLLPDAAWAWGACDGLFTPRPLAPLHDIAREVGGELLETVRDGAPRDDVFDAVLHWLSGVEPLAVLVIEDAQWADEATLDLLRFVGRRVRALPVLLVVTFRDDAMAPTDPLRVALGELAGQRFTRRIDLPPLTPAGVRRLAEGTSYSPEELYDLTGGNPFYVVEVLSDDGTEVPASARDAVLARAARLSDAARTTLDLASLDSWRLEPELVARAARAELNVFDELVSAGLLKPEGPSLRFRHELARRAIESGVPPHRRTAGHRALLQSLIDDGCDDDARLAYHAEEVGDAALVAHYAPRAARHAAELGAFREAAVQYERALRYPPDDPRQLAELYDGYADALAYVDSWPQAATARERAVEIWRDLGEARREGRGHGKLFSVYWRLCRGEESVAQLRRAIELLTPLGDDPVLAYLNSVEAFHVWPRDPDAGIALLDEARAMAERVGDPVVLSDVLNNAAAGEFALRRDWTRLMREALRIALDAGAEGQAGRAYANAYTFFAAQYRFAEGERFWRDGIAYCDERDIMTYSTCLRGHRAMALMDMGHWDDAVELAEGVLATEASPVNLLTSQRTLGLIRARRGEDDVFGVLDAAVEAAEGVDETEYVSLVRLARAEAHWLAGDEAAARADLAALRGRVTPLDYLEDAQLSVWEQRLLGTAAPVSPAPGPWATSLVGEHSAAAVHWERLGCEYHAALSLYDTACDEDLREAIARFEALGAEAAARRTRQRMKDLGHRAVPTGARSSTRQHPAGLTRREDEVLMLLCEGLTNEEIAGRLVLSTRTVDHHVSAVLSKLGVSSRGAATAQARRLGLVPATT